LAIKVGQRLGFMVEEKRFTKFLFVDDMSLDIFVLDACVRVIKGRFVVIKG